MAVTYDFQTPGVSTSAADTQEDIRNIAEASATLYNQSHSLSNIPTNAVRWNTSSKKFELYNGASWGNLEIATIVGSGSGILSLYGTRMLINSSGDAQFQIVTDNGNTGTTTWDPKVTFHTYITQRAKIYTDTSDSHKLKFDVGGSDQMVIDSSGNVGIGTSSPDAKLHAYGATSGGTDITAIRASNNGGVSAALLAYQNSHAEIRLGTAHDLLFKTDDNNERCRVTNSGDFKIKNGNLVIQTAGKGIDFSATSGTGTSELLDDYEEGTFTPTLIDTNADATFTHDVQKGRYTKVGDCVYFSLTIGTDSVTAGTGDLRISGLPFTAQNSESQIRPSGAVGINYSWGTSPTHWQISSNSDEIILYKSLNPITTSKSADCDTAINDNRLFMHGFYFV